MPETHFCLRSSNNKSVRIRWPFNENIMIIRFVYVFVPFQHNIHKACHYMYMCAYRQSNMNYSEMNKWIISCSNIAMLETSHTSSCSFHHKHAHTLRRAHSIDCSSFRLSFCFFFLENWRHLLITCDFSAFFENVIVCLFLRIWPRASRHFDWFRFAEKNGNFIIVTKCFEE